MRSKEQSGYEAPWSGVAHHGSNIKSGPDQDSRYFYRQFETLPDELVERMLDGIDSGFHTFDNLPYGVTILGSPHLMTVRTPSIGAPEITARLLLWGEHSDYGISNLQPWMDRETITYATVSGHVFAPNKAHVYLAHIGEEFDTMDTLFWSSLNDQKMQERITAMWQRREMIKEARRFQEIQGILIPGQAVSFTADQVPA